MTACLLTRTGCAWPVSEGAPWLYCDAERARKDGRLSAYCAEHLYRKWTNAPGFKLPVFGPRRVKPPGKINRAWNSG